MTKAKWICLTLCFAMLWQLVTPSYATDSAYHWTTAEQEFIESHINQTLTLGLDPYSGMDYFEDEGSVKGYVINLAKRIEHASGLKIQIEGQKTWSEVYEGLFNGQVDILFGANETPDRLLTMAFTDPVYKYPYVVMSRKNSAIQTIGDLDGKKVGYIEGDIVIDDFPKLYKNIRFNNMIFDDQQVGLKALKAGKIDGFITANGGIVKDFMYQYPQVGVIAEVRTVTSDMTLSTLKQDKALVSIINKVIQRENKGIQGDIRQAERDYTRKMLQLNPAERQWLNLNEEVVVGVADDYLPFDYFSDGKALGISGKIIATMYDELGIHYKVVHGSFDDMYDRAMKGEIDVLNIAKTEERKQYFIFPKAYSEERDAIYGNKSKDYVQDVYELEGKRVAVIKGFWHKDYLLKNLNKVEIIETKDIQQTLELVNSGYADYFIENPTVAQYYIEGLDYPDIIQKGSTSSDSFLYFGVNGHKPELASIMDKAMSMVNYEQLKDEGLQTVPVLKSKAYTRLVIIALGLLAVLIAAVILLMRLITVIIRQRTETQLLKEREKLIYTDALTKTYNRMYFNHIERNLEVEDLPQTFIMTDLNHLKTVNDSFGHQWGDALIVKFAELMKASFPDSMIIRMGGDEFLIICNRKNEVEMKVLIQDFIHSCASAEVRIGDRSIHGPEAAFGSYTRIHKDVSVSEAISYADQAMYACKANMKASRK